MCIVFRNAYSSLRFLLTEVLATFSILKMETKKVFFYSVVNVQSVLSPTVYNLWQFDALLLFVTVW